MNGGRESETVVDMMPALWVSASVQRRETSPLSPTTWAQKPGPQPRPMGGSQRSP